MSETAGKSGIWKLLVGCAIGFGVLVLLAVGSCVGFAVWMTRPGTLVEPARLTGSETVGDVNWTLRLEDPGTERFVRGVLDRFQEIQKRDAQRNLPPFLQSLTRFQERSNEAKMRAMFPMEAGIVIEPGDRLDEEGPQMFGYLSLKGAGNRIVFVGWLVRWLLGWTSKDVLVDYSGERILPLAEHGKDREASPAAFMRGNDIFIASRLALARTAVDRLNQGPTSRREATHLDQLLGRVPVESAIRGAIVNEHGELAALLAGWLAEPAGETGTSDLLREAREVTMQGGFQPDRSLELDLAFECGSPECQRSLQALVRETPGTPGGERAEAEGLALTFSSEGTRGGLRARCQDPAAAIEAWFKSLDHRGAATAH